MNETVVEKALNCLAIEMTELKERVETDFEGKIIVD